jgi:hypothetical protein
MNAVSVLKSKKDNPKSQKLRCATNPARPVHLLEFLEAQNAELRQTVAQLSLDTMILREALRGR